jgi:septal ring factor EnvC (AmiA/AmiB activator)
MRSRALAYINKARSPHHGMNLDFLALALRGKGGFDKVIKMIDDMTVTLKKEQEDDNAKKDYCLKEFDTSEDKKKVIEQAIADAETAIDDAEETMATSADEIKALEKGIKDLDESVDEATEQRKKENAE